MFIPSLCPLQTPGKEDLSYGRSAAAQRNCEDLKKQTHQFTPGQTGHKGWEVKKPLQGSYKDPLTSLEVRLWGRDWLWRRHWTRSLPPTGINLVSPAGKHLDVSANIPRTVTFRVFCCSGTTGFAPQRPTCFLSPLCVSAELRQLLPERKTARTLPLIFFLCGLWPRWSRSPLSPNLQNKDPEFAASPCCRSGGGGV